MDSVGYFAKVTDLLLKFRIIPRNALLMSMTSRSSSTYMKSYNAPMLIDSDLCRGF